MSVVSLVAGRMTETQYARERGELGPTKREAGVRWEQDLARLFVRSGWTQEELAKREGKSQAWIVYYLRYGRFLGFITTVINAETTPQGLTERKFRSLWDRTDKCGGNERQRFSEVAKLVDGMTLIAPRRGYIGEAIKEHFGDGKWNLVETIAAGIGHPVDQVREVVRKMRVLGSYGCDSEERKCGKSWEVRIFPKGRKPISPLELIEKLAPIIKELRIQGKCNMATMSPAQVAVLANRLQKQLDEWTE